VVCRRLTTAHSRCTGCPATGLLHSSPALPLLALVQRELRPPHTPTGEHPRGGRDRGGEYFEDPTDVWLPGGFEDDHGNRPFGPLLVAGVALESRDDLGPELVPLHLARNEMRSAVRVGSLALFLSRFVGQTREVGKALVLNYRPFDTTHIRSPCSGDGAERIVTGYPQYGTCFARIRSRTAVLRCA
jgi:hypothetical protein